MFQLTKEQLEKLNKWCKEQDKKVQESQKGTKLEHNVPYYGASGGSISYIFTPTSLGLVIHVRNNYTKEEIDLTDYNDW